MSIWLVVYIVVTTFYILLAGILNLCLSLSITIILLSHVHAVAHSFATIAASASVAVEVAGTLNVWNATDASHDCGSNVSQIRERLWTAGTSVTCTSS